MIDLEQPPARWEICALACAEAFRGDGEILASPMGTLPQLGARLARATFEPDLLLSDGQARLVRGDRPLGEPERGVTEGYLPFRAIFDFLWTGRRHVMMGASQIDRFGNQNISAIGPWARPKVQLLGVRGAPGNTLSHATSYWVPNHGRRVFVEAVDIVSGVGADRARALGPAGRFHALRRVVTNLAVLDAETQDGALRLRSVHPGVTVEEVLDQTGFALVVPEGAVPPTPSPDAELCRLLRNVLDPHGHAAREVTG